VSRVLINVARETGGPESIEGANDATGGRMVRRLLDLTPANRADGRIKTAHTPYRREEGRSAHQMSAKRIYLPI
jgi:hypothetical protein